MSGAADEAVAWPQDSFWDYSLALYRQPGVEAACLELQARHGIDVNLVLLCVWLADRGVALDRDTLTRVRHAADGWQAEVVRPLRAVRTRLKARPAALEQAGIAGGWPGLTRSIRARVMTLELDAEHLEQLHLGRATGTLPASAAPGPVLAGGNLRRYWRFDRRDRKALRTLLERGWPRASSAEADAGLAWLAESGP